MAVSEQDGPRPRPVWPTKCPDWCEGCPDAICRCGSGLGAVPRGTRTGWDADWRFCWGAKLFWFQGSGGGGGGPGRDPIGSSLRLLIISVIRSSSPLTEICGKTSIPEMGVVSSLKKSISFISCEEGCGDLGVGRRVFRVQETILVCSQSRKPVGEASSSVQSPATNMCLSELPRGAARSLRNANVKSMKFCL